MNVEMAVEGAGTPHTLTPPPTQDNPTQPGGELPQKKRKHGAAFHESSPSPILDDPRGSRPILTISRHPVFTPVPNSPDLFLADLVPPNRMGYRYTPAGLTPPGNALLHRTIEDAPTSARVSWSDRSPFLKVSQDGLCVVGEKGFRSARFNTPLREGKWFFEMKVLEGGGDLGDGTISTSPSKGSYVRLGFGRREASLNGPVGGDGYSYGIRDKTGERVHLSRLKPYSKPFGTGDVVGLYISLPPRRQPDRKDTGDPAYLKRERIAIEYKGQEYFESVEYPQEKEMMELMDTKKKARTEDGRDAAGGAGPGKASNNPASRSVTRKSATVKNTPGARKGVSRNADTASSQKAVIGRELITLPDSCIAFFVNGECQGIAFQDLYSYLPMRRLATAQSKRSHHAHSEVREGLKERKPNPHDDGTLGYYPFISLFGDARVRANVGPDFDFDPGDDIDRILGLAPEVKVEGELSTSGRKWRPLCERYKEFMEEQWELDALEEADVAAKAAADPDLTPVLLEPHPSARSGGGGASRNKRGVLKSKRPKLKGRRDGGDRRSESVFGERGDSSTPAPHPLALYSETRESYSTPEVMDEDERLVVREHPSLAVAAAHLLSGSASPRVGEDEAASEQGCVPIDVRYEEEGSVHQ
jgi:COMPASS component BRE2